MACLGNIMSWKMLVLNRLAAYRCLANYTVLRKIPISHKYTFNFPALRHITVNCLCISKFHVPRASESSTFFTSRGSYAKIQSTQPFVIAGSTGNPGTRQSSCVPRLPIKSAMTILRRMHSGELNSPLRFN